MRAVALLWLLMSVVLLQSVAASEGRSQATRLRFLPAGAVKPSGWIAEQLRADLEDGLTGNYDRISINVNLGLFESQERTAGDVVEAPLGGREKAWWAGEHEGYWKDAVIRSAFLVNQGEFTKRAHQWVAGILEAQGEDGYIGIYNEESRFPEEGFDGELWTQSRIFQALLAYYEFTGDESVLRAVEEAVNLTLSKYMAGTYFGRPGVAGGGGVSHGIGFMDTLEWLHRLTGSGRYREGAIWLYKDYSAGDSRLHDLELENLLVPPRGESDDGFGPPPGVTNLARQATVSAASEFSEDYRACFAVDGEVPASGSRADRGKAWAVRGTTHGDGAWFSLSWSTPQTIACVAYFGRTAYSAKECWKSYEVRTGTAGHTIASGTLKRGHGAQVITFSEPVRTRRLKITFTDSHGGSNPGASEIMVFPESVDAADLGGFYPPGSGDPGLFQDHTPHILEGLHMPWIAYAFTGKDKYRRAGENGLEKLAIHTNPGGSFVGDERVNGRRGSGDVLGEYCSMTEGTSTLNRILAYTGKLSIGDRIERVCLNAAQGARFHPANRAVCYLSRDNQRKATEPPKRVFAATHKACCCTLNAARLMPYYVEGMWYRLPERPGLVANLYGPCRVNTEVSDIQVEIVEKTSYPFSDWVEFQVSPEEPVEFQLVLRVPDSAGQLSVDAGPGATVRRMEQSVRITKTWHPGDVLRVNFNFRVERCKVPNGKSYYRRGPLIYALELPARAERTHEFKLGDEPSGFYRYGVTTSDLTGWDYRIDPDARFDPVRLGSPDSDHPWARPPAGLRGKMLDAEGQAVEVILVPVGTTLLRRVTFPVAEARR